MVGSRGIEHASSRNRAQSGVIGVVLILALTIIGATAALAFGAAQLDTGRVSSQEAAIEHAMTQLDSEAALVGLGDSDAVRVPLSTSGTGGYSVKSDVGWINVTHHNYDDTGSDETVINETLGAVIYEKNNKEIAYQGGGVWKLQSGTGRMISPPEFHYRSATLTLPIIRIKGSSSAGGSGLTALIKQELSARAIYPNSSQQYTATSEDFKNPVRDGSVTVTIHSKYYQAWANFFRARSAGDVTVWDNNDTVELELTAPGTLGEFDMPLEGNAVEVRGLNENHAITNFTIVLIHDNQDSADFSNLEWSMWAKEGGKQFEIHFPKPTGTINCPDASEKVPVNIYYSDDGGSNYHAWTTTQEFKFECENTGNTDFNDDGDFQDKRLVVNLTGKTKMEYGSLSGGDPPFHFSIEGSDELVTTAEWDQHDSFSITGEPKTFTSGDKTRINNTTNHYMALMAPDFDLTVADAPGNTVSEDDSRGNLEQSGTTGVFVKFMHITENRVSIKLE